MRDSVEVETALHGDLIASPLKAVSRAHQPLHGINSDELAPAIGYSDEIVAGR